MQKHQGQERHCVRPPEAHDGTQPSHVTSQSTAIQSLSDLQLRDWFPNVKVSFAKTFGMICAHYGDTRTVQRATMISDFFHEVSLQISQDIPAVIAQHLKCITNVSERREKTSDILEQVLNVTDQATLERFLPNCLAINTALAASEKSTDLVVYLTQRDEKGTLIFHSHLTEASHLDIADMLNALKKSVLKTLQDVILTSKSDVVSVETSFHKYLKSYDWVKRLPHIQTVLKGMISSKQVPTLEQLESLGMKISSTEYSAQNKNMLKLLKYYGIIECQCTNNVLTFQGASLSLNEILREYISKFDKQFKEVHFMCTECFYINTSIRGEKNIAICSPRVIVMQKCTIDVSGVGRTPHANRPPKAANDEYSSTPGPGAPGKDGKPGKSGTSGGNILIQSDFIVNLDDLALVSNGGDGGHGQDGGDGQDGVREESASEPLTSDDWPKNSVSFFTDPLKEKHARIVSKMESGGFHIPADSGEVVERSLFWFEKPDISVYSRGENGVQLLFGFEDSVFARYGFLFSKSKDGASADGGNAGMGGKGGGGGKKGSIKFMKMDGTRHSLDKGVAKDGKDGVPGKTGKCGKRAIALRASDYLLVNKRGYFGTTTYPDPTQPTADNPLFIDIKPWILKSESDLLLGSQSYYIRKEVVKHFDSSIDNNKIGFFKVRKSLECTTKNGKLAVDGEKEEQTQVLATTMTTPISEAALSRKYLHLESKQITLHTQSPLLQSLAALEQKLEKKLEEQVEVHEKEYHRNLRCLKFHQQVSTSYLDFRPSSEPATSSKPDTFDQSKINDLMTKVPEHKVVFTYLQSTKDKKKQQYKNLIAYINKLERQTLKFRAQTSEFLCWLLDIALVPLLHIICFTDSLDIKELFSLLDRITSKCHSDFKNHITDSKHVVIEVIFAKCKWFELAKTHSMHLKNAPNQHIAVAVYKAIMSKSTIDELKRFSSELPQQKISMLETPVQVQPYKTSYKTTIKLKKTTLQALESLTVFINEVNSVDTTTGTALIFPDIFHSVIEEYKAFGQSISDSDLFFVINLLQDKLLHVLNKASLEDHFYESLLVCLERKSLTNHSVIICDGWKYIAHHIYKVLSEVHIAVFLKPFIVTFSKKLKLKDFVQIKRRDLSSVCKCEPYCLDILNNVLEQLIKAIIEQNQIVQKRTQSIRVHNQHYSYRVVIKLNQPGGIINSMEFIAEASQVLTVCIDQTVCIDSRPVQFPDALFISHIDVDELWIQLKEIGYTAGKIPSATAQLHEELKALPLWPQLKDDYKKKIVDILRHATTAECIPFDILSYHRPTKWVEQLFLYCIKQQHTLEDITSHEMHQSIIGLSESPDKTMYFIFFNQFLNSGHHLPNDILHVLQSMKKLFIDQKLCTLVTKRGINQVLSHSSQLVTDCDPDFIHSNLVTDTGLFRGSVTLDKVNWCCDGDTSLRDYLSSKYSLQQFCSSLKGKELTFWIHKLHTLKLRMDLLSVVDEYMDDSTYNELLLYIHMLIQHHGHEKLASFMRAMETKKPVPIQLMQIILSKCAQREWIFDLVLEKLKELPQGIEEVVQHLDRRSWKVDFEAARDSTDIVKSIKNTYPNVPKKLDEIVKKVAEIRQAWENVSQLLTRDDSIHKICEFSKDEIYQWALLFKKVTLNKEDLFHEPLLVEAFAVICRAITLFYELSKQKEGIIPRDTQMVSCLLFFQDLSQQSTARGKKLMLQIATGEGKTMILSMIAIIKVLLREKVDIVTSSSILAIRDAQEQEFLYELFDIRVSHCCHDEISRRRDAYKADIIYGDVASFQRDILDTKFYDKKIRTSHDYDNVFIDEVDSMLVDKGETMLYLPHAIPQLSSLESIYIQIWLEVNKETFIGLPEEQDLLYEYFKHELFGGLRKTAFTRCSLISWELSSSIHAWCIDNGVIDGEFHVPVKHDVIDLIRTIDCLPGDSEAEVLQQEIVFIIQEHIDLQPLILSIPTELHQFVKKSLRSWIQSAVAAKFFRPNKEYIIDIDRRRSAADRYPKIIIMDNETGVEQESSEWGSALHQFLQLKHHLRLTSESLKAVYMSNITFFRQDYHNVVGVTGTLGSKEEEELFHKLYKDTEVITIPTNMLSKLKIEIPQCCSDEEDWLASIEEDVHQKIEDHRVVLLICEDIDRGKCLHNHLHDYLTELKIKLYTSSYEETLESMGELDSSTLIIATNLAGRGTDVKLTKRVKDNGGLHVCLSYLPPNVRIEQQAYGRAARSGDPGSCKMIFISQERDLSYAIRKRDLVEAHRVADIEADYYHNIRLQEELFACFTEKYENIKSNAQHRATLDHCLDRWAIFLDKYSDDIESIPDKPDKQLERDRVVNAFEEEYVKMHSDSMSATRLVQLGHSYMKQAVKKGDKYKDAGNKKDLSKAVEAYEQARKLAPEDPFIRYYLAAATLNKDFKYDLISGKKKHLRKLKQEFYQLIPLMQERIVGCQTRVIELQTANRNQDQSLTDGILYYKQQKDNEIEVYTKFMDSMQDIIGRNITPQTFEQTGWKQDEATVLFLFIKDKLELKDCRISKYQEHRDKRLNEMLTKCETYQTFQSKIRARIECLSSKKSHVVTREDFTNLLPDKRHFWSQLQKHHLISVSADKNIGHWNPECLTEETQFDQWDSITAESFSWISALPNPQAIVDHLTRIGVLNERGVLVELDLSKPFKLPHQYTQYYKCIKDTLVNHSIYRYAIDHLQHCVLIDLSSEIDDEPFILDQSESSEDSLSSEIEEDIRSASNRMPKLTHHQLNILVQLKVIKERKSEEEDIGRLEILLGVIKLEEVLPSVVLSEQDIEQIHHFLQKKLEVDFKTLNAFPKQFVADQHLVLYDDLCRYSVIKQVKVKASKKDIKGVCKYMLGYKGLVLKQNPYFCFQMLNNYLKNTNRETLTDSQERALCELFVREKVIRPEQMDCLDIEQPLLDIVEFCADVRYIKSIFKYEMFSKYRLTLLSTDKFVSLKHSASALFLSSSQRDGVEQYIQLMIQLKENVDTIVSTVQSQCSTVLDMDTPEITLKRLSDIFADAIQEKGDVLSWFADNQCHLIIDLAEKKWSQKSVLTAVSIIVFGVAQIVAGAVLLAVTAGAGSMFCGALLGEGISDMIFGIIGLCRGYCSLKDYLCSKLKSVAFAVTFAGIGFGLSGGNEVSKYFYKTFFAVKKLIAEKAGTTVCRFIAKKVAVNVARKVGGAVAAAGINLVVDAIVNKCSNAIERFCAEITKCFDTMSKDHTLREKMLVFLRQNSENSAYLHQLTESVLQPKTFLDLWDEIESKTKQGVGIVRDGFGQVAKHLQECGAQLKKGNFIEALRKFSHFSPLVTSTLKSMLLEQKMRDLQHQLIRKLEEHLHPTDDTEAELDEARRTKLEDMVDAEFQVIKKHFTQVLNERTQTVIKKGLHIAAQVPKCQAITLGKKGVAKSQELIELSQLKKLDKKAKLSDEPSEVERYNDKMMKMMSKSCSPEVFAYMISKQDAYLGPAFALPALEKELERKITLLDNKGKPMLNVLHHSDGKPGIFLKFENGYFCCSAKKFTTSEHGNDCLIKAAYEGAGKPCSDGDAYKARLRIAAACTDKKHPCYHYITCGIARNYVQIGVVGGAVSVDGIH